MRKIVLIAGVSFISGVYCADSAKEIRSLFRHEAKEGFAHNPYNLRIVHRDTPEGTESYVLDTRTNEHWKVKDKKDRKDDTLLDRVIDYFAP